MSRRSLTGRSRLCASGDRCGRSCRCSSSRSCCRVSRGRPLGMPGDGRGSVCILSPTRRRRAGHGPARTEDSRPVLAGNDTRCRVSAPVRRVRARGTSCPRLRRERGRAPRAERRRARRRRDAGMQQDARRRLGPARGARLPGDERLHARGRRVQRHPRREANRGSRGEGPPGGGAPLPWCGARRTLRARPCADHLRARAGVAGVRAVRTRGTRSARRHLAFGQRRAATPRQPGGDEAVTPAGGGAGRRSRPGWPGARCRAFLGRLPCRPPCPDARAHASRSS
jgi:hypothetical protein